MVALFLRFYGLGSQSFWIDEISVASFVKSGHLLSDLRDRGGPFEPPLHYLTVLAALQLPFGFETAARMPSALFGALEVLALMLLAREATNRRITALVAGVLLAFAPFVVRYSQENRYYVMFSALSLLSWWLLLRALRVRGRLPWLWYGVVAAAMQLTHPFTPLVLITQALVVGVVWWRERKAATAPALLRGYALAIVIGVILILPWYAYGATEWIPGLREGRSYTLNPPGQFAVPLDGDLFSRAATWLFGNSGDFTALVVVLVVLAIAAPLVARGRDRFVAAFALAYAVGFMVVLVPLARALGTYFAYRRVESLVPPLLLAVAVAVVGLADRLVSVRLPRPLAYSTAAVAFVVVVALSAAATLSYYDTEKTNFRGFARVVRDAPDGRVVYAGPTALRAAGLIQSYLHWKGVDRRIDYLVPGAPPAVTALPPDGVTWLTGSPPNRADVKTRSLNDLSSMQVIAGDRSGLLIILPWFVSTSRPTTTEEFVQQRDALGRLGPFMAAPK